MDVDKYAPFTSSPLDSSRCRAGGGGGRRLMIPRLRATSFRYNEPTVVIIVSQTQPSEQTSTPQVGGSSIGKNAPTSIFTSK